jgi:hypothetical protein
MAPPFFADPAARSFREGSAIRDAFCTCPLVFVNRIRKSNSDHHSVIRIQRLHLALPIGSAYD